MTHEDALQTTTTTGANAPQTGTIYINTLPDNTQVVGFGHRSGAETHQACPRRYFLNYEYLGRGIVQSPGPLYFAVGTAVHHGLANLLLQNGIDVAVEAAHASLVSNPAFLALDNDDSSNEQLVLVEGLLYAFYVYALPGLLNDFEVLCVETGAVEYIPIPDTNVSYCNQYIAIQSRPDAILRNRKTHEVCGISWKTIDDPSDLRRSQLVNDLQGFMELYYGEKILQELAGAPVTREEVAKVLQDHLDRLTIAGYPVETVLEAMRDYAGDTLTERVYQSRNIPTQIDYIQTIFLVKGARKLLDDDDLTSALSHSLSGTYFNDNSTQDEYGGYQPGKRYRQMSHLCYRYRNPYAEESNVIEMYKSGPNKGKPKPKDPSDPNLFDESWAYRFFKPGNETGSSLSSKWLTSQIQPEQIREWIDKLNAGEIYPSVLNDERNVNPIAKIIKFEEPLYKDAARAASHVRQQHNRFVQIARAKQELLSTSYGSSTELNMQWLDELFPQQLISCKTPYKCPYHGFCHGPELIQIDFVNVPPGFELRVPHHQSEREFFELQSQLQEGVIE